MSAVTGAARGPQVADRILALTPYNPGTIPEDLERARGGGPVARLAANENPLGPSSAAVEAAARSIRSANRYPDATASALRTRLAALHRVHECQLVFGNGSDELIHQIGVTLLEPGDSVVQADPSFVLYRPTAVLNRAGHRPVPLDADWAHDLPGMRDAADDTTRIVFVCNPNNPTGTLSPGAQVRALVDSLPARAITVVDEAYAEYAAADAGWTTAIDLVRAGANVIVLRTFSKAFGLAGFRIGYAVTTPEIADWLERTRPPFNINMAAHAAAVAALDDTAHLEATLDVTRRGIHAIGSLATELGLEATPSAANFVWLDVRRDAIAVAAALELEGVLVRASPAFKSPVHIRVSIGTPADMDQFATALRKVLGTAQ